MGVVQWRPSATWLTPVPTQKPEKTLKFAASAPAPGKTGSKVRLWKQDPSVEAIGIRTSYLHTPVQAGPKDDFIAIRRMPTVSPDSNGDFLTDNKKAPKEFDAIHTFAVVRQVVTMYQRALNRMGIQAPFQWQWGNQPINVHPHAGNTPNAYYSRNERAMKFFHFTPPKAKEKVYTCRSFDIVSHETGHAVLDGFKPGFLSSWHPETGGLHESFGDLTAIFTMLSQLDQCEAVIAESKTNLYDKNFFNALAEEFGQALGRPHGLRNANNNLKMSDVSSQVHDISQVFTGAVYDVLADMFNSKLALDREDPALTLFKVGEQLNALLIGALLNGPARDATYKDIAEEMLKLEKDPKVQDFIRQRFTEREILGQAPRTVTPQALSFNDCCDTLKRPEHKQLFSQAIAQAQQLGLSKIS